MKTSPNEQPKDESPEPAQKTPVEILDAETKLMKAARGFGLCFDEDRQFADGKRLELTLSSWRELALAALAYAQTGA